MTRFDWCRWFHFLRGRPISFDGRPYLRAVYDSEARRIVLRCSRQVEKTTFLCNAILHAAATRPGVHIAVVFPRHLQAGVFARSRLAPMLETSPFLRRVLLGRRPQKLPQRDIRFVNGSEIYIRSAYLNADGVRGIDADLLFIDEYQDIAADALPVLEETMSHAERPRVILTGTPKTIDNQLEAAFNRTTANEWRVRCGCGELPMLDEKCLGPHGPVCPACGAALNAAEGEWVPRNPGATWGDGFSLNHLATPWLNYAELLERQRSYSPPLFRNECLGLPTSLGDHIVTREEVEACCGERAMARSLEDVPRPMRPRLVAGVDWGGGVTSATVLVIGAITDQDQFEIYFLERLPPQEDPDAVLRQVVRRCQEFGVRIMAADGGGNGATYNPLLLNLLPGLSGLYGILYSGTDSPPVQWKGRQWTWTINRSASLGLVFARVKTRRLRLPRLADASGFLADIWCEVAEYDDQRRTIRYTHPETQPDDALHAINYASTLARRGLDQQVMFG